MSMHNNSYLQHYAIKFLYCAEYYFRGDCSLDTPTTYCDYIGSAFRYASFATIIPPLFFLIGSSFAYLLIKPDEKQEYWKEKIVFPYHLKDGKKINKQGHFSDSERKNIYAAFCQSGITDTVFKKIVIIQVSQYAHGMSFTGDGHFPAFFEEEKIDRTQPDEVGKVLVLHIGDSNYMSRSFKEERRQGAIDADRNLSGMVMDVLNNWDSWLLTTVAKLPNEVMHLISLDPADTTAYKVKKVAKKI